MLASVEMITFFTQRGRPRVRWGWRKQKETALIQEHCVRSEEIDLFSDVPSEGAFSWMSLCRFRIASRMTDRSQFETRRRLFYFSSRIVWKAQDESVSLSVYIRSFCQSVALSFSTVRNIIIYISCSPSWMNARWAEVKKHIFIWED